MKSKPLVNLGLLLILDSILRIKFWITIAITFTIEATIVDGIERLRRKMHEENQQTIHEVIENQVR